MLAYHDEEWGVPVFGSEELFGKLVLDGFQAGLSWAIILRKRDAFLRAFDRFDPERMARYGTSKIQRLLSDRAIVRNRLKIEAAVENARAYLRLREQGTDFGELLWSFVGGRPRVNHWKMMAEVPAATKESHAMSKELERRGFRFVGPTICYAFMQAVGMVNDHLVSCYRHKELAHALPRQG